MTAAASVNSSTGLEGAECELATAKIFATVNSASLPRSAATAKSSAATGFAAEEVGCCGWEAHSEVSAAATNSVVE